MGQGSRNAKRRAAKRRKVAKDLRIDIFGCVFFSDAEFQRPAKKRKVARAKNPPATPIKQIKAKEVSAIDKVFHCVACGWKYEGIY